jgi:hypothetical protein
MTSAQTILVATDLSAPARHAVERAFHLAASSGSELYILHAMELDALDSLREMLGDDVFALRAALSSDAHSHLDQLLGEVGTHRGIAVRTCVAEGNPLGHDRCRGPTRWTRVWWCSGHVASLSCAALYWDRRQPVWCASRRGGRYWW